MAVSQSVVVARTRSMQRSALWRKMALLSLLLLSLASTIVCQSTSDRTAGLGYTEPSENGTGVFITTVSGAGTGGGSEGSRSTVRTCRDRLGTYPPDQFRQFACGMCFMYLYNGKVKTLFFHRKNLIMYVLNATGQVVSSLQPHVDDPSAVDTVCAEIVRAGEDCDRWTRCCGAAKDCCERQLASEVTTGLVGSRTFTSEGSSGDGGGGGYCPRTWDGYSCWDDTEAGNTVSKFCPSYIDQSVPDAKATKQCTENGTWFVNQESMQEWTDYTGCVMLSRFAALFWVGVVCNAVSLILLAPACFIFLYFRSLRNQHRIRLHVCLFSSFILTNALMILWEVIVVNNRRNNEMEDTVLHQNSVGCRILHALTRYSWTTNFLWMWLEGLHLYRLMVHAFAVPRSLVGFYVGGFTAPLVPTFIYVIIRATKEGLDIRCWVTNAGAFEWIIYTPIIFCLVGNLFFLGKILWVMLNQLQSHPNEPSSYRRAMKAVGILIPLFGLQVLLVIYQPTPPVFALEVFSKILSNTQGAAVALGFCYVNGEVLTVIRNALPRSMRSRSLLRSDQRSTMSTQFTTDMGSRSIASHYSTGNARAGLGANGTCYTSQHEHSASYIPLTTMGDEGPVKSGVGLLGKEDTVRNGLA